MARVLLQEPTGHLGTPSHSTEEATTGPERKGVLPRPHSQDCSPAPLSPQRCCTEVAGVILKSAKLVKSLAHFCSKRYGLMVPNNTSLPRGFFPYLKFLRQGPGYPEPSPTPLEEESGASSSPGATFSWWHREGWRWLLAQNHGQERGFQARTVSSSQRAPRSTGNLKRFWFTGLPQACFDLFQEHSTTPQSGQAVFCLS